MELAKGEREGPGLTDDGNYSDEGERDSNTPMMGKSSDEGGRDPDLPMMGKSSEVSGRDSD